jgi:hypothetical protein
MITPLLTGLHKIQYTAQSALAEREVSQGRDDLADLFSTPAPVPPSSLRVVCAWHEDLSDPSNQGISHGICPTCAAKLHAELDAADVLEVERTIEDVARERRAA